MGHSLSSWLMIDEGRTYAWATCQGPFWQARYYDFNVHNEEKRGLAEKPEDWPWSSFRHYSTGEVGTVAIESQWAAFHRGNEFPQNLRYREGAG